MSIGRVEFGLFELIMVGFILIGMIGCHIENSHEIYMCKKEIKELQDEAISRGVAHFVIVNRDKAEFQWTYPKIENEFSE